VAAFDSQHIKGEKCRTIIKKRRRKRSGGNVCRKAQKSKLIKINEKKKPTKGKKNV
jgi:hypothetical protein